MNATDQQLLSLWRQDAHASMALAGEETCSVIARLHLETCRRS